MGMLTELKIPHMGSVENAKVLGWLVPEGGAFKAGQPLYEIETDKTVLEVEAEADGVLARCEAREGDEKKVGDRVGYAAPVGSSRSDIDAALRALAEPAAEIAPAATRVDVAGASDAPSGARISPLVRRLAAEHGVDLSKLEGSGPGGRIVGDDVLRAAQVKTGSETSTGALPGYEGIPVDAVPNTARR